MNDLTEAFLETIKANVTYYIKEKFMKFNLWFLAVQLFIALSALVFWAMIYIGIHFVIKYW